MIGSKHFSADEGLEGLRNTMELISMCWGSGVHFTPDPQHLEISSMV